MPLSTKSPSATRGTVRRQGEAADGAAEIEEDLDPFDAGRGIGDHEGAVRRRIERQRSQQPPGLDADLDDLFCAAPSRAPPRYTAVRTAVEHEVIPVGRGGTRRYRRTYPRHAPGARRPRAASRRAVLM